MKDNTYSKTEDNDTQGAIAGDTSIQLGTDHFSLHYAAKKADMELVELLIEEGANVNEKDDSGETLLHYAAERGQKEIAELLIERGANVNEKDDNDRIPLHYAAQKGYTEIVKLLIKEGADVNAEAICNLMHQSDIIGILRTAPLHLAAEMGHADSIKLLVEKGADVNAKDTYDKTSLHYAAQKGYTEIAEFLIKNNADVNAKDNSGETPLHYAVQRGQKETVELLIKNEADVNAKNDYDETPLHLINTNMDNSTDIVKILLINGAKVDIENDQGKTPLQLHSEDIKNAYQNCIETIKSISGIFDISDHGKYMLSVNDLATYAQLRKNNVFGKCIFKQLADDGNYGYITKAESAYTKILFYAFHRITKNQLKKCIGKSASDIEECMKHKIAKSTEEGNEDSNPYFTGKLSEATEFCKASQVLGDIYILLLLST